MAWIIKDVLSYHTCGNNGTVINWYTMEPRLFTTKAEAEKYARLSCFRKHTIEAYKHDHSIHSPTPTGPCRIDVR